MSLKNSTQAVMNGMSLVGQGNKRIPTNLRALQIIEALAQAGRPLTPTELNEIFGLPKATIHRLCSTLLSEGYLEKDERGGCGADARFRGTVLRRSGGARTGAPNLAARRGWSLALLRRAALQLQQIPVR